MVTSVITSSASETVELGAHLAKIIPARSCICLHGDLGSGKTTLIKGLASALSGSDPMNITSPTFLVMNLYEGKRLVVHFDLYRISSADSLIAMGADDWFGVADLCCIEWPERLGDFVLPNRWNIHLEHRTEDTRHIKYGPAA